ncbi:MAG: WecB/TagA/CpsF family glycosyltransferase [Candidatus Dormibacteria bacterium]
MATIIRNAEARQPCAVSALAVHGVMTGALDPVQRSRLNAFDLLVPDGQPVRWALRWLHGVKLPDRVCGRELMLRVCREAADRGLPIFLYGSTAETLARMVSSLRRRMPALLIAGSEPSRFRQLDTEEREAMLERIRASGASVVFVGLGCPRQEVWVYENSRSLGIPVIAVGAAFPFEAGLLQQAPRFLQVAGLEWFFRLVREPRRLWKRYVLLNPLYLIMISAQLIGAKFAPCYEGPIPEQRFG